MKTMRFWFLLSLCIFYFLLSPEKEVFANSNVSPPTVDLSGVESEWDDLSDDYADYFPSLFRGDFQSVFDADEGFSFKAIISGFVKYFFHEVFLSGNLLGTLILLSLLSSFLKVLQSSFEQSTISKVADVIVISVFMLISLGAFKTIADVFLLTTNQVKDFLMALFPVILGLIAASGGVISATFFSPVLLFLINASILVITFVTVPFLYLSTILGVASQFNKEYSVSGLADVFRKLGTWTLGVLMSVVIGFLSIQGVSTSVADGVGAKSLSFITANFIPVVGRFLTDATNTVVNLSVVMKNTVGVVGLGVLLIILILPAVKIFVIAASYKLAAVAFQPLNHKVYLKSLEIVSKNLFAVFASYVIFAFFVFLALTIVIMAGNIPIMVR